MNAEQHAQAILSAIQAAEAAGYRVEAFPDEIMIDSHFILSEPQLEDGIWEFKADD